MNAERWLAHYERIADTPGVIPRLRRFILDLAIRGKLVEQNLNDEPASNLLKRIAVEKARLVKAGEMRKTKDLPELPHDELPFPLPPKWQWSRIAEIGTISPRNNVPDAVTASFVSMPMISAQYGIEHEHQPRSWATIKKGYTHFSEGDVGLAKITPCFENGKSTVFRNLTGGMGSGTTELHIVRPLFVNPDYIIVFLKCPHFIQTGIDRMTGTAGQKRIPTEYFANAPFPLPPLAEQHRIVAKVNELMALCGQLQAAQTDRETTRNRLAAATLARLNAPDPDPTTFQNHAAFALEHLTPLTTRPDQINALHQTILNLAICGKLVEQDSNDEPASELLRKIAAGKARLVRMKKIKARKETKPAISSEVAFTMPAGWSPVRIEQILIEMQTGPFGSALHQSDYQLGGVPVVNPASIQNERIVPIAKMAVGPTTLARLASFQLQTDDIIMGRRGEMGRCAVITERERGWLCGTGSLILRVSKFIYPRFLSMLIGSPFSRQYLSGTAVGTTMQNLNQTILLNLTLGLPPLAEQHRIVAKVDELMALCDRLEQSLATGDYARRRLLEIVLHDALAPNAEPKTAGGQLGHPPQHCLVRRH